MNNFSLHNVLTQNVFLGLPCNLMLVALLVHGVKSPVGKHTLYSCPVQDRGHCHTGAVHFGICLVLTQTTHEWKCTLDFKVYHWIGFFQIHTKKLHNGKCLLKHFSLDYTLCREERIQQAQGCYLQKGLPAKLTFVDVWELDWWTVPTL